MQILGPTGVRRGCQSSSPVDQRSVRGVALVSSETKDFVGVLGPDVSAESSVFVLMIKYPLGGLVLFLFHSFVRR